MHEPLVTIGMSALDSEATLATAIRSLLAQTYRNWELVLIDDGSRDTTLAIARRFTDPRIRIVSDGANKGLPARLNQAIDLARGDYFARLDADDLAYPDRLEKQIRFLREHPGVDLVGGSALVFRRDGEPVGLFACSATHEELAAKPWNGMHALFHPTWTGRTSWFRRFRYDVRFRKSQDRDILLRAYRDSRFACMPDVVIGYRQESLSLKKILTSRAYYAHVLLSAFSRSRDPRFLWGIALQVPKALVEIVAVVTGLNYRLLRHRAPSVPAGAVADWERVWTLCEAETDVNGAGLAAATRSS